MGKIQLHEIFSRNVTGHLSADVNKRKIGSRFGKEIVTSYLDKGRKFEDKILDKK